MELKELIRPLRVLEIAGDGHAGMEIADIQSDSRKVGEGCLFVAVRGITVDGHAYIKAAVEKGATAILCEEIPSSPEQIESVSGQKPVFVKVADTIGALGKVLPVWYNFSSDNMVLVGVTGTNGKTTIATLLYEMFRKMGHKVGLISTVCNYINDEAIPTDHTTPDSITLYSLIDRMDKAHCEYIFMEVSSHSIDQRRIGGLLFDGAIFTNLTRDHLDYHKTVENYLKSKKKLFDNLSDFSFALTNADDKAGLVMLQNTEARKRTYSLRTLADFKGKILESHFDGTELLINDREVMVRFVGRFNAYNLLAVYGAAIELGKEPEEVLVALSSLHSVPGRFETLQSPLGYTAIVDYAHTPDALTNVLDSIREVLDGGGRLITVVGCGGNRDRGKRPLMAKEAVRLSDQLILTSDNPRFEDPEAIIREMVAGLNATDMERTLCITDRMQAIKTATMQARKGDVILVAGKGHEDYQDIKGEKHPFDDREMLRDIFAIQKQE